MSKGSASLLVNELLGSESEGEDDEYYDDDDNDDQDDDGDDNEAANSSITVPIKDLVKKPKQAKKKRTVKKKAAEDGATPLISTRDWKVLSKHSNRGVYFEKKVGDPFHRLSVHCAGHPSRVFLLAPRHDSIEEIVADLIEIFPPLPGSLGGRATLVTTDGGRPLAHVRQLYHDEQVTLKYDSILPVAGASVPALVVDSYEIDDDGNRLGADDTDPDADIDDKLVLRRILNPGAKTDAQLDAELDALLGADDAKRKTPRAASRSVGKSRDWAAKSRERLQRSFHELQERLLPQAEPTPNLNQIIVDTQLNELRALREAYAPPLLIVGDAVPLRLAFRLDGTEACELAERASPSSMLPCQLCVIVQLPIAYPKEAATVKAFWTHPPSFVDAETVARVDVLDKALRAKCAAQVGQPLLHELMTDASDWMAAFVSDAAVVEVAKTNVPPNEITEAHRVAWIHQLRWAFEWDFAQWPAPENEFLFYERARYTALEELIERLEKYVRERETIESEESLVGWVGAPLIDDAVLTALSSPRRLLASGRTVMSRWLAFYEWSVDDAFSNILRAKWQAVETALGFGGPSSASSSAGSDDNVELTASVVLSIAAGLLKTPAHATKLLLDSINAKSGEESEKECEICLCDYPASDCTALACGHWFCDGCYTSYISLEVSEARVSRLSCPSANCAYPLGDVSSMLLLGSSKAVVRLLRFAATAQVADDKRAQQCMSTDCGVVMRATLAGARRDLSQGAYSCCDKCTKSKCMRCQLPGHWPASCAVAQWSRIVFKARQAASEQDDELMTLRWIVSHTKDCPKCASPIEKNLGCNHMHCASCNYDFCWICLASWTGAHYSCTAGREASHTSLERYTAVPLSFIGIRNWHIGRLEFARLYQAKRVTAMTAEMEDYADSRVLRDAFQWMLVARQVAITAAEMGECLKTFTMPCQKHLKMFCVDMTTAAEHLNDVVFEQPAFDPNKNKTDLAERALNRVLESAVANASGVAGPKLKRLLTAAERATVFSAQVHNMQIAMRQLNRVLRSRLWPTPSGRRLVRYIAAAKAAGKERGDPSFGLPVGPEIHVVRVHVHRAGTKEAVGKELLVATDWRVFVHEAASMAGVISDSYVVVDHLEPAAVYLASGARVGTIHQLTHEDSIFLAPLDEPFQLPPVIEAPAVLTAAEQRALKLQNNVAQVPVPTESNLKWRALMASKSAQLSTTEREREQQWQKHEPSLFLIAGVLPPSLVPYSSILTALQNTDGDEHGALKLLSMELGVSEDVARQWRDLLTARQGSRSSGRVHVPVEQVWAADAQHREAQQRRRAVEEFEQVDAVRQIRNVLPHVAEREAVRAWLAAGRNVEQAMGQLLDGIGA